ncbi:hypothetical protein MGYG_04622 [Nannizzia gypsea CBS 118893]|uniref:DNA-directed RNA polymerase subunit n=1 Tax=Arthroderma gypseum (strain ATCC MYA-4604 / CBS 118893) TaxID=535722 RepID=E4UU29_ARTGP|nr:hypothetical protein MGYG_04622 [Nannizzia gypsea CBS 118893]EFR01619.1 hypothetical protein MGYG_04622 [Nannizzia gypsea CBS 118893]
MAPQFCDSCGMILDELASETIQCDICGELNTNRLLTQTKEIVSTSSNFPSKLRFKRSQVQVLATQERESRTIQVDCEKCDAKEVTWAEMQLRSADEGSTIFYSCSKCGHR